MTGLVVTYASRRGDEHELAGQRAVAGTLAAIMGYGFAGPYEPRAHAGRRLYFVPNDSLTAQAARALGIRGALDLFGGVVPFAFVATKAIVHPLAAPEAHAPPGWSPAFASRVHEVVLPGYSAFTLEDARRAAEQLLARGPIRLKRCDALGGQGQLVVNDRRELEAALRALDPAQVERRGVCVEVNLAEATTYSIGEVRLGELRAAYYGTQRTTTDNRGAAAFGGSDLVLVRGSLESLGRLRLAPEVRVALEQARAFDAASAEYPGFFASRRNYDVARGRDGEGRSRCGVLEQSWRIGGASGPEAAALAAFHRDPALRSVRARSTEAYGAVRAPAGAIVHFSGIDRRVGALTKYTELEPA